MTHGSPSLLEREAELRVIGSAVQDVGAGTGRLVVVVGPPGVGKTALLLEACAAAAGAGLRVLRARGTSLEQPVGFGVARQLLEHAARDLACNRDGPESTHRAARNAGVPLGLSADARATPTDPSDAEGALLDLVIELTHAAPLALVADDVHWADESSLRVLSRAGSRIDSIPLLVIVAARPRGEPDASDGTAELLQAPGATLVHPRPLSAPGAATLVRAVTPAATDDECRACAAASRGNPLFVRELAVALSASTPPGERGVPPSIAAAVDRRLASLSPSARSLAEAVAVFEPRATLARCAQLTELARGSAVAAMDELIGATVLESGVAPRFVHPVVRDAVHDAIAPARRAQMHADAAAALHAEGVELDAVASHLLQAPALGEARVVQWLVAAAGSALIRGTPEAAITYLRRAIAEPPPSGVPRAELLVTLGQAEMLSGSTADAERDLRRAMDAAAGEAPASRLHAAMALGQLMSADDRLADGVRLLEAELRDATSADAALLAHAETVLLNVARMDAEAHAAVAPRAQRLRRFVEAGGEASPEQLAAVAAMEGQAGVSAQRTAAVARRALAQLRGGAEVDALSFGQAVRALIAADGLPEAITAVTQQIERSRRRGVRFTIGFLVAMLAEASYRAGSLPDAERFMREALTPELRWEVGRPAMVSILVKTLLEQGERDKARALIDTVDLDSASGVPSQRYPVLMALQARGRVRLAAGDPGGALLDFEQCGVRLEACAEPNPALVEWRSDAAWALLALGDRERAWGLADDELVRARAYGAARSIGIAGRVRAAAASPSAREQMLRDAVSTLGPSPARLEYARASADLGILLGRGAEAREHLRVGLELAEACGARPLARRVRRALSRAGARPRRSARSGPESLTAAERRVVELAVQGLTNRAIAEQLVVAIRTVELHLTNSYRKLNISSRSALPRALTDAGARSPDREDGDRLRDLPRS